MDKTTKQISYAYSSSINAERFGFGKTGCYCVELIRHNPGMQPPVSLAGFATWAGAWHYAKRLWFEFDRMSMPQPK
jgi:hypothetical protein